MDAGSRDFKYAFSVTLAALFLALLGASSAVDAGAARAATGFPTDGGVPVACSANTSYTQSWRGGYSDLPSASTGVVTRWMFQGGTGGGTLALQTLKHDLFAGNYTPIGESAIEAPAASTLNTFNTRIPVSSGDQLQETVFALRAVTGSSQCLYSGFQYDEVSRASPAPVIGSGPTTFGNAQYGLRLNLDVVIEDDEDGDGFGDSTQDGCPRRPERQDDCVKPTVTLEKAKPRKRTLSVVFSSDEAGGTFECHLEKKKFSPCSSPMKLKKLKPGRHNFTVRAIDASGNASSQTSFAWNIPR